jgi:uncharacterized protein YjbI with pentapeptide repeats
VSPRIDPNTPHAPRLGTLLPSDRADLLADLDWYEVLVAEDLSGTALGGLNVRGARGASALFVGADLQRSRLIDAVFESCDLSGASFDESALTRVEFRDCRLSGVQFNAGRFADVRFAGCRLDGASFRMAQGNRVWFEDCILKDSEFSASELTAARFERCELTGADFSQARIPDAPLLGSILDGLRGVGGLQRPIIDATQVVSFAYSLMTLHGVVVLGQGDDE